MLSINLHYHCQKKTWWFDKEVMLAWVKEILKPYVADVPCGIASLLLLDDFKVHKMGVVVQAIQALGMEVDFTLLDEQEWCSPLTWATTSPLKPRYVISTMSDFSPKIRTSRSLAPLVIRLPVGLLQPSI